MQESRKAPIKVATAGRYLTGSSPPPSPSLPRGFETWNVRTCISGRTLSALTGCLTNTIGIQHSGEKGEGGGYGRCTE